MANEGVDAAAEMAGRMVRDVARAGEVLLGAAVRDAPLEEGTLRGSAELALIVNGVEFRGTGSVEAASRAAQIAVRHGPVIVDAEVSFNTVYAARQHEELDWQHPLAGGAKYLERNLVALAPRLGSMIRGA